VKECYARELQITQRLCDELEVELRNALAEARAHAAQHGEELREWHADDRLISAPLDEPSASTEADRFSEADPFTETA
jgi:hypothetical protein